MSSKYIHYILKLKPNLCELSNNIYLKVYELTLNSIYNEVTFNEKSAITKEKLCTKYFPFTYKYVALNKKAAYNEGKSPHPFFSL